MIYYKSGYKYQLTRDYSVYIGIFPSEQLYADWIILNSSGLLICKKGYAWDGPSGPTIDTKSSMRGSLVHDALYQLMRLGLLSIEYRECADRLLKSLCIESGMDPERADLWYHAVRFAGRANAEPGSEREEEEAP